MDKPLKVVRVSWWKHMWYHLFIWMLLVPTIMAFVRRFYLKMMVYDDRVVVKRGIIGTNSTVLFIRDIQTIEVHQSFWQRVFGFGDMYIATAGTSGFEEIAMGIPDPMDIKDLILSERRKLRKGL